MPESKVIILTGASRGIGLAIAQYLLKASHKLVLVARSAEPLEKLKSEYHGQVEYVAADLANFSVCTSMFSGIVSYINPTGKSRSRSWTRASWQAFMCFHALNFTDLIWSLQPNCCL
jgi:short-subunit dehydrogenase